MPRSIPRLIDAAVALFVLAAVPSAPWAQDAPKPQPAQQQQQHRKLLPADSVTQHSITVAGRPLDYSATAGTLPLTDDKGETTAEIFYVSFTLANAGSADRRPVTYLFNGGPGAASAYLDIGAIGPRAIEFGPTGALPPREDRVADNPDTWLPFTDLVFIDPVGTGYSRATGGEEAAGKQFWGVTQDLETLAEIVRLHLAHSGRNTSPVYLVGESYGGFRAARLAYDLASHQGLAPAGAMMISPVIDFGLMTGGPLDPLPSALRLPSYAAAALGPKALEPDALKDAESFALNDYLVALAAGPQEGPAAAPLYQRLATLTGLDEQSIARWHGRIPIDNYLQDVERRDGRVVSRYDGTVSAVDPNPWNPGNNDDPVLDRSIAPFTAAFTAYVRDELGFKTDQPFELLNHDVSRHWSWQSGRGGEFRALGSSDALRRALALDPRLKVLIAHGVSDLQTPYMMSRYIKEHMPDPLGKRVALKLYLGGHMMYLRADSRRRLHDDAQEFYAAAAE
jgi:carboxypeptidase C (cathepsin A)